MKLEQLLEQSFDNPKLSRDDVRLLANNYTVRQYGGIENLAEKVVAKTQVPFRGLKFKENARAEMVIQRSVRQDRVPMDTNRLVHSLWNKAFFEAFGYPYRSAAAFATTKSDRADRYGLNFVVLPNERYTVCFSPKIKDLYINDDILIKQIRDRFFEEETEDMFSSGETLADYIKQFGDDSDEYYDLVDVAEKVLLQYYKEVDSFLDLPGGRTDIELMIGCKSYTAVFTDALKRHGMYGFKEIR